MSSVLIGPINRKVALKAILAMLVNISGSCVSEDPLCGVPRKRIPITDLRMLPYNSSSIMAVTSALKPCKL